jgi:phage terminase Nu1 subunit (DNA packaging protein)
MPKSHSTVLDIDQAATMVHRSVRTLRGWVSKGWLPVSRQGGKGRGDRSRFLLHDVLAAERRARNGK